jgi:hypothetical protein
MILSGYGSRDGVGAGMLGILQNSAFRNEFEGLDTTKSNGLQ